MEVKAAPIKVKAECSVISVKADFILAKLRLSAAQCAEKLFTCIAV